MNKIFDIRRFGKYLAYDLRNAYSGFGLNLLVMGLSPAIFFIVKEIGSLLISGEVGTMAVWVKLVAAMLSIILCVIFAPARLYGHLTDKRGGTDFLMIPASVLEKWLSMMLVVCVALPVALCAVLLACDGLLSLVFPGTYCGTYASLGDVKAFFDEVNDAVHFNRLALAFCSWCTNVLIFTLGAICFKKSKPAKTILAYFVVSMVFSTIFAIPLGGNIMDLASDMAAQDPGRLLQGINVWLNVCVTVNLGALLFATWWRLKHLRH